MHGIDKKIDMRYRSGFSPTMEVTVKRSITPSVCKGNVQELLWYEAPVTVCVCTETGMFCACLLHLLLYALCSGLMVRSNMDSVFCSQIFVTELCFFWRIWTQGICRKVQWGWIIFDVGQRRHQHPIVEGQGI
jgi:hypothetical protein